MKLLGCPVENKKNASLTRVVQAFDSEAFHSMSPECFEVHFIFGILGVIGGLRATRVYLVLEVGTFFGDRGDFPLCGLLDGVNVADGSGELYFRKDFLALKLLKFWHRLLKVEACFVRGAGHSWRLFQFSTLQPWTRGIAWD